MRGRVRRGYRWAEFDQAPCWLCCHCRHMYVLSMNLPAFAPCLDQESASVARTRAMHVFLRESTSHLVRCWECFDALVCVVSHSITGDAPRRLQLLMSAAQRGSRTTLTISALAVAGTPLVKRGRPLGHQCQPNKTDAGLPATNFGSRDPAVLFGPQGWCNADKPKFQCACDYVGVQIELVLEPKAGSPSTLTQQIP